MKGELKDEIVQLKGRQNKGEPAQGAGLVQISRRRFLQMIGVGSAAGAAGCASDVKQNVLPFVKPDPETIPGVAVWYSSTCTECSAGCGIRVRTREGRAVKIEGNPHSPVNRGSLCALGQASLQALYDPDRIRQPLKLKGIGPKGPEFEPATWDEVYNKINEALTLAGNKKVILTGELQSAHTDLIKEWSGQLGVDHVVWDSLQPTAVAKASEMVFGIYGIPTYHIDRAEVVLNFGADFLETWVNPVGYARQWSDSRRSEHPLRFIHVEPRLSLTGANADMWLKASPATETPIVLYLIKSLIERGYGQNLSDDVRAKLSDLTKGVSVAAVAEQTGVPVEKLVLVAEYLANAKSSLVLAGGTAASTEQPLPLLVAVNFLNMVLGNIGKTVDIVQVRQPRSSATRVAGLIDDMQNEKVDVLFTFETNPEFTFPQSFGYGYGVKKVGLKGEGTNKKAGLVVAFSSHLDETARLADFILPTHTFLEDWGYTRPEGDSVSLIQPSMSPIFDTRSFGDILLTIAQNLNKPVGSPDIKTFDAYVKAGYKKSVAGKPGASDSESFWIESLDRGGLFIDKPINGDRARVTVSPAAFALNFGVSRILANKDQLVLYPYPSVKTYDGRAANRPWMQELPDPITRTVWGSWAEIHPATAKRLGLAHGDAVILRTDEGETHVPAYITDYVHEGIVAVPIGQGHSAYGRFAQSVGQGSVVGLLPKKLASDAGAIPLLGAAVEVKRGLGSGGMVEIQETKSQLGRELARTTFLSGAAAHAHGEGHGDHSGHHEEVKQMYHQREHPLYQWGMTIDLAACTGCSACVVACYAENNIPVVGKKIVGQGRDLAWLRIDRYYDQVPQENGGEELKVSFQPMLCQHCQNAPCEPVCPVYATYHTEEGLNAMVYNRCVGTRYCSNNCSYKVRRFNWFDYEWPELLDWQANPDVTKRSVGVMEKCTFCLQRITEAKDIAKDLGRAVEDGDVIPACVQTCPTQAITFGNLKDSESRVSKLAKNERAYKVLDHHLNTQPSISYLDDIRYKA